MEQQAAIAYLRVFEGLNPDAREAVNIAINSIRLMIADEPIDGDKGFFKETRQGYCPNCGRYINNIYNEKHCGRCGQAIDWRK